MRLAELLLAHWPAYQAKFGRLIPPEQCAAVRAILRCRTPALGGQRYACACGRKEFAYHSCNHRACPRCGQDDASAWLAQQRARLLPVPYFLVTFTVPEELRAPIRAALKPWYGALLKESAGALQDLAADPKHLGAELGITAMLQTWTRDLRYHPHVHLLVPGGGLTANQLRWVRVPNGEFLVPQVKLAARFKGRLKAWLKTEQPEWFAQVPAQVWWRKWVVDVQPVGGGEVLERPGTFLEERAIPGLHGLADGFAELFGHGEGDQEVRHGQQPGALLGEPHGRVGLPAAGTGAMVAGVIGELFPATGASIALPAQRRGPAPQDGAHGRALFGRDEPPELRLICRPVRQ